LNETVDISRPSAANDLVSEIWERTFGIPARRGDHLLDVLVNGSGRARSIQVGELFSELAVATGVQLPSLVALESPTAADLVQMVCSRSRPSPPRPVLLRSGEAGRNLFFLPGLGGIGLDAVQLARHFSFPGSVYLNPPRGLDGAAPDRTLDALVADHVEVIRNIQPHGPYWLLGYSWGGLVALEIARALRASGETIAFLGVIDTVLNQADWTYRAWLGYVQARMLHHLSVMRRTGSAMAAVRHAQALMVPVFDKLVRPFGVTRFWPLAAAGKELPASLKTLWAAESEIIKDYRLSYYKGAVTFFAMQSGNSGEVEPGKV
jgi:pimeloyl-ACP methyl ester carboxylesterase